MSLSSVACSVFGAGSEEQPSYTVILKDGDKEIRLYDSYVVAKTSVKGSFKDAQSAGFRILAGYIFGKNKVKSKIAMTSSVVQKEDNSQKIAMTAPVVMKGHDKNSNGPWTMTFTMPSKYNLETLPEPIDKRVKLGRVEARLVAAFKFSGFWSRSKNKEKEDELIKWLDNHKNYTMQSRPMFAGYNPPWTLPFLRRNEILLELKEVKQTLPL